MPFSTSKRLHDNHTLLARYYSQLAEKFPDLKKDNPDLATMSNLAQSESNAEETDAAFQEALANFRKDYARYAMGQQAQWCGDNPAKCELEGMAARGVLTTGKIIGGTIDGVVGMAQHMGTRGNQVRDAVDVPVLGDALGVVGVAAGFVEASAVGLYHAFTDVLPSVGNALYDSVAHPEYSNMQLAEEYAAATLNVQGVIGGVEGFKAGVPQVKALGKHLGDTWNGAVDAVRNGMDSNGGMIPVTGTVQGGTRTAAAAATLPPLGNGLFGPLAVLMASTGSGGSAAPAKIIVDADGLVYGFELGNGRQVVGSAAQTLHDILGVEAFEGLPKVNIDGTPHTPIDFDAAFEVPESLARVDDAVPTPVALAAEAEAGWTQPNPTLSILRHDTPVVSAAPPVNVHPAFQGLRRLGISEGTTGPDGFRAVDMDGAPVAADVLELAPDGAVVGGEIIPPNAAPLPVPGNAALGETLMAQPAIVIDTIPPVSGTSRPTTPRTLPMGSPSPTTTPVAAATTPTPPLAVDAAVRRRLEAIDAEAELARRAAVLPSETLVDAPVARRAPPPLPVAAEGATPTRTPAPAPATAVVPIDVTATAEHAAVALPRPATPPPLPAPVALPAELPPPPAPRTPAPAAKAPTPRPLAVPKGKVTSGPRIVDFVVEGKNYRVRFNERGISRITRNGQDLRNDAARAAKELLFNKIGEAKVLNAAGTPIPPPWPKVATPAPAPKVPTPVDTSAPTEAAPAVETVVPAAASPVSLPVPRTARRRGRRIAIWTTATAALGGLAAAAIAWNNERKRVNREKAAQEMLNQQKSGRKK